MIYLYHARRSFVLLLTEYLRQKLLQCNNSASLNNLDMSAPITTTSTTVTIANSVESQVSTIKMRLKLTLHRKIQLRLSILQPNQQTDDKNEAGSAEETERSNR